MTDVGKTALITGASSWMGRELATLFAKDGWNLVLVAHSENKLQELADTFKQQFGTSSVTVIENIGVVATVVTGIALAAAYKNSSVYDQARYRHKAGRAYGSAKKESAIITHLWG